MKKTESLNKNKESNGKRKKMMTPLEKEDYKALKYFMIHTRAAYNYEREQSEKNKWQPPVDEKVMRRLERAGYIAFHVRWKEFYDPEYLYTKDGLERYSELRELNQRNWMTYATIGAWVVSAIALLKSFGII